jgi:cyclohexyl-isocyanide hydratase
MTTSSPTPAPMRIVALVFPNLTQLDLTGPAQVFARLPDVELSLAWHDTRPVPTGDGWSIVPTVSLDDCPPGDVLFVPGGDGVDDIFNDEHVRDFLRTQAASARYVTSVCTGSLALAAAGLLTGYRATSHWASVDLLAEFGVTVVHERVVIDRNRITGAGVTSGIDFALTLAAQLFGPQVAQEVQLRLEYDPQPPFHHGSPGTADPALVARLREAVHERRRPLVAAAVQRLNSRD